MVYLIFFIKLDCYSQIRLLRTGYGRVSVLKQSQDDELWPTKLSVFVLTEPGR